MEFAQTFPPEGGALSFADDANPRAHMSSRREPTFGPPPSAAPDPDAIRADFRPRRPPPPPPRPLWPWLLGLGLLVGVGGGVYLFRE